MIVSVFMRGYMTNKAKTREPTQSRIKPVKACIVVVVVVVSKNGLVTTAQLLSAGCSQKVLQVGAPERR